MEDEEESKLEQLIRDLALKNRETPPPPVPPRPTRRSAPAASGSSAWSSGSPLMPTQSFDPNNGDLGLPLVNGVRRENYNKVVLNKRMWVSLKETEVECDNLVAKRKG